MVMVTGDAPVHGVHLLKELYRPHPCEGRHPPSAVRNLGDRDCVLELMRLFCCVSLSGIPNRRE